MKFQVALLATALTGAYAHGCTGGLLPLALGDLGSCLQLTQILSVVGGSGPVIQPLNTYLTSLCSSNTPRCSNSTLQSANSTIVSACASDLSAGGSSAETVRALQSVLGSYPYFYAGGCSKNSTTNNFCVVDTLTAVQNATGQQVSFNFVASLLSGSGDGFTQLNSALGSGQLCTGCVSGLYQQAVAANATISSLPAAQSLVSRCGAGFGTSASGVSSAATSPAQTSGGTSSSASASSSRAAGNMVSPIAVSLPAVVAALSVVGGVVAGGLAVM